jgi:hypothetical protein
MHSLKMTAVVILQARAAFRQALTAVTLSRLLIKKTG